MKTVQTVKVISAIMKCASGYGQYSINIEVEHEGKSHTIKRHSTDSHLFDTLSDLDSDSERSEYILENQKYLVERGVEDYINTL